MRDYDGYYRDGYYEPPPRRYRRRRRGRAGLVIFALILILALVFVWRFTDGFTRFAPPELTNVQDGFTYSLDALAGEISPDMRLDECGIDYKAELESMAANKPKLADRLNFIADHLEIYPEEAVKTALQGEEKLDFALLMPFRGEDAGGVNAVITAQKGTVPYLIQYDSRWAYHAYGSSVMGITACGPTCLSMAAIGLTGDAGLTPRAHSGLGRGRGATTSTGRGTAWSLFTDGAAQLGLRSEAIAAGRGRYEEPPRRRRGADSEHAARRLHDERALHRHSGPRPLRLQRLRPELDCRSAAGPGASTSSSRR